jgi:hypothetical protein
MTYQENRILTLEIITSIVAGKIEIVNITVHPIATTSFIISYLICASKLELPKLNP